MNNPLLPSQTGRLWHGGDYSPEQWGPETWREDERLMDLARWTSTTVGVFSWVSLEPEEGVYEFGWMDQIIEKLQKAGRSVVLATPTAAAPAWLSKRYPETLRTDANGVRRKHGNRVNYCLTSPIYREKAKGIAKALAERYGHHPSLALWHVSNEYGGECHCELCASAFRSWLRTKFGNLDALNQAYWTSFWGHTYTEWDQIEIPGQPRGETAIHGLTLDWKRFVTDQTISLFEAEAEILRAITPSVLITTNFMGFYGGLNYFKFAKHLDIVSWDSYPRFSGPLNDVNTWQVLAMAHDLNRGLKGGQPFLLMECTPSASNWYPVMSLKHPGMHMLEAMQAIAHGSDSVQYFQWRQSRGGQEKFHGAVVAHDGTEHARVFKEVAAVGARLEGLHGVAGANTKAEVAILYSWENAWAIEAACGPMTGDRGYLTACKSHHAPFWEAGIPVDIISDADEIDRYALVIAPMLYMVKPGVADRFEKFVESGGTLVGTYWSGIADENDLCFQGGFPGPLKNLFGIWAEEIDALDKDVYQSVYGVSGNELELTGPYQATVLCERIHTRGAEVLATYVSGFYEGMPALTRNDWAQGSAYYVASRNDEAFHADFFGQLIVKLGLKRTFETELPTGVMATRRDGETGTIFLMNFTDHEQTVVVPDEKILKDENGAIVKESVTLGAYEVKIYRE